MVKYLVSVRETLSAGEMERLKKTAWLPREELNLIKATPDVPEEVGGKKPKVRRYEASSLYEVSFPSEVCLFRCVNVV